MTVVAALPGALARETRSPHFEALETQELLSAAAVSPVALSSAQTGWALAAASSPPAAPAAEVSMAGSEGASTRQTGTCEYALHGLL